MLSTTISWSSISGVFVLLLQVSCRRGSQVIYIIFIRSSTLTVFHAVHPWTISSRLKGEREELATRIMCVRRSVPLQALRRVSPTARLKARAQCSWEFGWNTAVENSWPASKVAAVAVGTSVRYATLRLRCWAVRGLEVRVRCAAPGTSQRSATINPSTSQQQRCRTP